MKKLYFAFFITIILASSAKAQPARYAVRFKDKKGTAYSISQPSGYLSLKAIQRRARQNIEIDSTDLPVNQVYIDSLAKIPGVRVINSSRWLNQVMVETSDPAALDKINNYAFVARSNAISMGRGRPGINQLHGNSEQGKVTAAEKKPSTDTSLLVRTAAAADTISYGGTYAQVHLHEGEYLHNRGFRGQGMTIAILDAGFLGYKANPAFDSARILNQVLGEYDFVMNETSVNEDNAHGANCFSILAANRPGIIVGTAPKANYWLFRTEDAASERPVEEQNWIMAAERADSAGADMISCSLGYTDFDNPAFNHSYAQRDGNTAMITIAADLAAKKGMIVMNSAGNSGNDNGDTKYIMCPADGDSVVTVGAVNSIGEIGSFSSWGPNAANRVKPNIVSVGWRAVYANQLGDPVTGDGTSYSNPNIAGLIACLWQAFSEFSNMDIIDAVQRSADRFNNPDHRYGYGIPNFRIAYQLLEAKREEKLKARLKDSWITVYPVPFKQTFTVFFRAPASGNAGIRLVDASGRTVQAMSLQVSEGGYYNVQMTSRGGGTGVYYLHYYDGRNKSILKLIGL